MIALALGGFYLTTIPAQAASTTTQLRERTLYMQRVMGASPAPASSFSGPARWVQLHPRELQREQARWRWLYNVTRYRFQNPPHKTSWLCIHRYEGSWTDPGAPYYGGLQMDLSFQRAYGSYLLRWKGTAEHWTPLEQMWVAERAHRAGRGFYPWPNTARYCGLL